MSPAVGAEVARAADAVRILRRHLTGCGPALARLAAWSLVEGAPGFGSGLLVATAVDRGFLAGRPLTGIGWLGVLAAAWAVSAVATRRAYPWLARTVEPLRDSLLTAVVSSSLRTAVGDRGGTSGAAVAQATVQVESVRALLASLLRTGRQLLVTGLAALAGLAVLSPLLALVAGGFSGLAGGCFVLFLVVTVARYRAVVLAEEGVTAAAAPVVTGLRDVVVAAAEDRAARDVGEAVDVAASAVRRHARARAWGAGVVALGAHLPLLALLATAPWLLRSGRLSAGAVAGAVVYLSTGLGPAVRLLVDAVGTVIVNLAVVLVRLSDSCPDGADGAADGADDGTDDGADDGTGRGNGAAPRPVAGRGPAADLVAERLTFRYAPHAAPVIDDLSLRIPAGQHLAVVGPSGAGKSTLADLLTGLAVPARGSVTLGGVPLARVGEARLRRTVALIPQEAYVFAGTLRDNLTYLAPGATDDEILAAAAAVGLTGLSLPGVPSPGVPSPDGPPPGGPSSDGGSSHWLGTVLDPADGALTPAARQLVALARVYLSPAAVVVLDEATCHLDPVAEARAERAFAARGGTLVVIAHRMTSALRADRILVLDGGGAVAGSHDELVAASPRYAELVGYWNSSGAAVGSGTGSGTGSEDAVAAPVSLPS